MSNMTVGLVLTHFDKGGLEQVVYNLYLGYKKRGIPTYILCECTREGGYFTSLIDEIEDYFVFNSDPDQFWGFCYKHRITHLHYHYNLFQLEKAHIYGVRTIYTLHNVYTWFNDEQIKYYGNKLLHADQIIAVSDLVNRYFTTRSDVPNYMVTTIPNGIDIDVLAKDHPEFSLSRANLKIAECEVTLAVIASFLPTKHQIGMIGVMERIAERVPNVKLLLVGNIGDKQYYETFMHHLDKSPAKKSIKVIPYFPHKYMGQFLRDTVDIFMLPTLQEGCSNAVLEAICCGKPMILTNVGNAQDVLNCSDVTIVNPAYQDLLKLTLAERDAISYQTENINTEQLSSAILNMVKKLDYHKKRASAFQAQMQMFSVDTMVEQYIRVLNELD